MFQSPSKEVFMGRAAVMDHLLRVGAKGEDVMRVERNGEDGWEEAEEMPTGWKVRTVRGLSASKVSSGKYL